MIEHKAIVEHIEGECVDVVMAPEGACAGCKAQAICGADTGDGKRITIHTCDAPRYAVGEQVVVSVERAMGMKAVAVSYIYPFLIMLATLLALLEAGAGELVAGLSSLGVLALYYGAVSLLRGRIEKQIVFTLRKE